MHPDRRRRGRRIDIVADCAIGDELRKWWSRVGRRNTRRFGTGVRGAGYCACAHPTSSIRTDGSERRDGQEAPEAKVSRRGTLTTADRSKVIRFVGERR